MYVMHLLRFSQIGVVSYGNECPSHGVYARVTEVKQWIQYITGECFDSNCNSDILVQEGICVFVLQISIS